MKKDRPQKEKPIMAPSRKVIGHARAAKITRREFLERLGVLWTSDGGLGQTLYLEDLLDDAAACRLDGASKLYFEYLAKISC